MRPTCIPTGQRWGDKIRQDYESHQQSNKTPPVTTSTDAMDTEEGDAITKMILDKTKVRARWVQRRSRLSKRWDMEPDDVPRPLSVPLPENYHYVIYHFPRLQRNK